MAIANKEVRQAVFAQAKLYLEKVESLLKEVGADHLVTDITDVKNEIHLLMNEET